MRSVLGSRASVGGVLATGRGGAAGNGLLTGLVAYWKLDEASGNAADAHTNNLAMSQAGSPGATTGIVYATARTFNGSAQRFYRASETLLQMGNIDFAIAAWVYPTATPATAGGILVKDTTGAGGREYALAINNSRYGRFIISGDGTNAVGVGSTALALNAWHFVVGWHDATADKIYIQCDSGTVEEAAHSTGAYSGSSEVDIGAFSGTLLSFTGRIGPVTMWKNRTLSAADRSALWNGGAGLAYSAFTA